MNRPLPPLCKALVSISIEGEQISLGTSKPYGIDMSKDVKVIGCERAWSQWPSGLEHMSMIAVVQLRLVRV